jgi:MFS transporter, SP family, solute carrier family 2 (myo-inositol transporter), member 13
MGVLSEVEGKESALHVEAVSPSSFGQPSEHLEDLDSIEQTQSSRYAWLVAITAGVGGLLFGAQFLFTPFKQRMLLMARTGYDTGIISAVLVYLNDDLGKVLNSSEKELITSITSAGAFIGAIAAGLTADRFGRKGAIYMGCSLFIVGAVIQASAYSLAQMTVGRLVVGFGVGSAAMIVPVGLKCTSFSDSSVSINTCLALHCRGCTSQISRTHDRSR